jgi:crotonobetainyl-CoA:carnitine CoA-transferase CaiB-like acyl-CoA transferase
MRSWGALAGLKVVDLSRVLAGPLCGQMLGDHGAQVIKVEPPNGDDTRSWGTPLPNGSSSYFESINRNKQNICLDLRVDDDRATLWRLLADADVVIENFKIGTMAGWGMDYEKDLAPRFPGLIYCRISGYGDDGPLGGLPGYDAALQAYSGLMSVNGEPDRDPMRIGVPLVDTVTGLNAVAGILMAVVERSRSGLGQLVECTLFDTALSLLTPHSGSWITSGKVPPRTGAAHPMIAPYETFHTSNGPFFVAAANDRQFVALADVLGAPELARDARFITNADRLANLPALRGLLAALFAPWDPDELSAGLLARGVTASPVNDVSQALGSAHAAHRGMLVEVDDYRTVAPPIKLTRTPGGVTSRPSAKNGDADAIRAAASRPASAETEIGGREST